VKGRDFVSRRDAAIIRLLLDTGARRGEIAGRRVPDVDLVILTTDVGDGVAL
jgi:integrase